MNITFVPLVLEIISIGIHCFVPETLAAKPRILNISTRAFLAMEFYWIIIFIYYVVNYFVTLKTKNEISKKYRLLFYIGGYIICSVLAVVFPYKILEVIGNENLYIIGGMTKTIINVIFVISATILLVIASFFRKKLKNIIFSPYLLLFILYIALLLVGNLLGYWTNNLSSFFGFIATIVFFTTENQDIKIIDNYNRAKEVEEKTTISRQKMLVNMSHEVRTPLHNIMGYGHFMMGSKELTEEEFKNNISEIKKSTLELKDTISNIYDISHLDGPTNHVNQILYSSKELYEKINEYALRRNTKENTRFTMNVSENTPNMLYGDKDKIYKIVTKLLENAIEVTNYGEVKFEITSEMLDHEYIEQTFKIINTGHVMSQELFDIDYEEFMTSNVKNVDYIKLGVIIAKKYIEIIGGSIDFINEEGKGTQYIIKIRQKVINTEQGGK
jgi:signal transduction histidine kinase